MRRFLREQGLSLFFFAIFVATLIGQSFAGQHAFNSDQVEHGQAPVSWWEHLTSPEFVGAVMENWQSEFLQFSLFIGVTVWLIQRGSNESKKPGDAGLEDDEKQQIGPHASKRAPSWAKPNDIRTRLYENSLLIMMTLIFFATWLAQSLNNWRQFNAEHAAHEERTVSWPRYLLDPDFWERSLQNWQSEFLAVGTMAVFTIYLRQRGSPESKPVGAPHDETASSG
ncbi:MAG: hypothetical protein H0U82_02705 [Actinobacteria bacterium]|nr:hypothetical protein [Actinomycetota bacterium]